VERRSAGDTVGKRTPRNVCRESSSPLGRARIGARLRVARDRHPAVVTSLTRCCGRGPGTVMATGSHEESLPAEGTPVITKRRLSRGGADDGLGGFGILRPVPTLRRAGRTARLQRSRRRVKREDEPRNRDTGVRGSVAPPPWEQDAHAHTPGREAVEHEVPRWMTTRRSVRGCRETPGPPESCTEPKSPWGVPAAKAATGSGNTRGAGARSSIGWQKSVRRIARLLHREVARPAGGRRGR
jgi:hypothetical protein